MTIYSYNNNKAANKQGFLFLRNVSYLWQIEITNSWFEVLQKCSFPMFSFHDLQSIETPVHKGIKHVPGKKLSEFFKIKFSYKYM